MDNRWNVALSRARSKVVIVGSQAVAEAVAGVGSGLEKLLREVVVLDDGGKLNQQTVENNMPEL